MYFLTMRSLITLQLILQLLFISCSSNQNNSSSSYDLPDLNDLWEPYDSLKENGDWGTLANRFFTRNSNLKSSELYVNAAWMYREASMFDSAAIALNMALDNGLANPKVQYKYNLEEAVMQSDLRSKINRKIDSLEARLSSAENFEIDVSPIFSFWKYYNSAVKDSAISKSVLKAYVLQGSPSVRDYYAQRYLSVENMYNKMVIQNPDHYQYTQEFYSDDDILKLRSGTKDMMLKLTELYSAAVFPKVYVMPGLINSGGTATELGLFVGGEMFVKSDDMPTQGLNEWELKHINTLSDMKNLIMHELMHFQQNYHDEEHREKVVAKVIEEGVCDFLVELCSGQAMENENIEYLRKKENLDFILREFKKDMLSKELKNWMYNGGRIKDRPSDIGYTLGYLICKSYYENSKDKRAAIFELLNTSNFMNIVRGSEYINVLS